MGIAKFAVTVLLFVCLCAGSLLASGFEITGIGTSARGMGGAYRAIADDWTAAYYNPAGYAWMLDNQFGVTLGLLHYRNELTPDYWFRDDFGNEYENGVLNDNLLYNQHEVLNNPSGGAAFRFPVWGETVFGFSIYQPFDYAIEWKLYDPAGAGFRAYNDQLTPNVLDANQYASDLDVVAFQLSASREFSPEKLSLGLGVQLLRADLVYRDLLLNTNPLTGVVADRPRTHIPEQTQFSGFGWGFGLTGGLMWKPTERLNVGLVGRLPFDITVDGDATLIHYLPRNEKLEDQFIQEQRDIERIFVSGDILSFERDFEAELKLPMSIGGGVSYQLTEKLLVALDIEYTFWSQYEGLVFSVAEGDTTGNIYIDQMLDFFTADVERPAEWDDAGKVMFGLRYDHSNVLTFLGGVSADQSPMRDTETRTPQFVDTGDKYGFNGGVMFHIDRWDLGIITSYFDYPDLSVNAVDVNGDDIPDSFPGEYTAETLETVLSVNYRF